MNRWSIHRLDRTLGEHASAWDALRRRLFSDNPLLDSRFVDALMRHFGDGSERLCIFRTGGTPQAMCILRPSSLGIWSTFLPAQAQIGPVLLDRPDLVNSLVHALPGICGEIDFLCNDPDFGDLSEQDNRQRESRDHALTMNVSLSGGFEAYWSSRSRNLIKNMRRHERRIEEDQVEIRLVRISHPSELDSAIARYAEIETNGWKGKTGTAVTISNEQGGFYHSVSRCFATTANAAVYELWMDDRLAASRITISTGQTLVILKTTYDESMSKYAPGRLLLYRVIRDMFERSAGGSIEFYTDADANQLSWATGKRWMRHVSFYRSDAVSSLLSLLRAGRKALGPKGSTLLASGQDGAPDQIEVYKHPCEFPKDVQNLFAAAETISFDFGLVWYRNLVDTVYPQDAGVRFYVLRRAGQPIAALPILIERQWGGNQAKSLANFYSALYAPALAPMVKGNDLVPLIHAICDFNRPLGSFLFSPMDPESLQHRRLLNALRTAGMVPFHFFCFGNWYLKAENSWPDYLTARGGALRSTIKRSGKKFANEGGRLEIVTSGAELERGLNAYEQVYATSWKIPEPFPAFVPGLIRACANRGWLRLGVAWIKDEPIAVQFWIVASGKAYIYKLAYNEDFKAYAPGTLLTATLMQHVIEQDRVSQIDYLIGDDPYKETWMSHRRMRFGLIAYNPRSILGLLLLSKELAGRVIRRLKSRRNSPDRADISYASRAGIDPTTDPKRTHATMTISPGNWKNFPATTLHQDVELLQHWDRLNAVLGDVPFLASDAIIAALKSVGDGKERLLVGYDGSHISAMVIVSKKGKFQWQTFQPPQLPLGAWVAEAHVQVQDLARSLIRGPLSPCLVFSLTQIDPNITPRPEDADDFRTDNYIDTAWIDIEGNFDQYWSERGKNLRQNMRKQRAKLVASGVKLSMQVLGDHTDMATAVTRYGELESAGWKGKEGTAINENNAQGQFYRYLLEKSSIRGEALVYQYLFDDCVVAMNLCLRRGGTLFVLKTTYDESIQAYSPAFLLRETELQEIHGQGQIKRIEYFGRIMEWHTKLTDKKRTLYHLTLYRWPFLKSIAAAAARGGQGSPVDSTS